MRFSSLLGNIFFPPRCAVCRELLPISHSEYSSGAVLCKNCAADFERAKRESCPACLCPSHLCLCSAEVGKLKRYALPKLLTYTPGINNTQNRIIYAAKHSNEKRLTEFLASELCVSLCRYMKDKGISPDQCIYCYVPRTGRAIREYGFDQGQRLARALARICEGEFCELFKRKRGREQKKLGAKDRAKNMSGSLLLSKKSAFAEGRIVVIVDDLVTTGQTLGSAAALLKSVGAQEVIVTSVAKTASKKS